MKIQTNWTLNYRKKRLKIVYVWTIWCKKDVHQRLQKTKKRSKWFSSYTIPKRELYYLRTENLMKTPIIKTVIENRHVMHLQYFLHTKNKIHWKPANQTIKKISFNIEWYYKIVSTPHQTKTTSMIHHIQKLVIKVIHVTKSSRTARKV